MQFFELATDLQKLETTASRNEMTWILAALFKKAKEEEIEKICYLALGRLGPKFRVIEFNLAEKMISQVLSFAYNLEKKRVVGLFKKAGDLGEVAAHLASTKHQAPSTKQLSVIQVYDRLYEIATESGEGSVERKVGKMAELLQELDSLSVKYAVRIPLEKLRLGFSEMTILDALSWMIAGDKSKREEIEQAYNVRADVGEIAKKIKFKGLKGLKRVKVCLGTPIVPALCQRLPNAEEMVKKMGKAAIEPKYDGQRLQVHLGSLGVRIFTRNLDNVTLMFPDIAEAVKKEVKAKSAILDGEAVGFESKTGRLLPFQETIKRKRKYQIKETAKEIPLKYFCFDVLYKDGQDLLGKPFRERRKILERTLGKSNKTIVLSAQIVTDSPEVIRRYHDEQVGKGLEGVVLKKWEAVYDPGKRGYTWVKFKFESGKKGGGLLDTIDCLVMGYYRGRGRRAGFGIGAFLAGVMKKAKSKKQKAKIGEPEFFVTVSKIGTGLSDEQWRELKLKINPPAGGEKLKVKERPKEYLVDKNLYPDVWCKPAVVVEIEADNITKSPIHTAGYALRFPRLVKFRDDKGPAEVTTLEEVKRLYEMQR